MAMPSARLTVPGQILNPMTPVTPSQKYRGTERHAWVDIAKGICIIAVVCLYAFNQLHEMQLEPGWLGIWTAFARPFRMPDFFLISGLFLSRVLDRPWRDYLDSKVAHYFYFIVLWSIFIFIWNWGDHLHEMGVYRSIKLFVYSIYRPEAMLWFIQTLSFYFIITRVLRSIPAYFLLAGALALRLLEYHTGIYPIDWFGEYYIFFLIGVFFAKYFFSLADWAVRNAAIAWPLIALWIVANQYAVSLGWTLNPLVLVTVGMIGILAIVMISSLINRYGWVEPIRFLGRNSIVVYLGFYLPMRAIAKVYLQAHAQWNINVLGSFLVVASIASAVVLFWCTRGTVFNFLFERPSWARLIPRRGSDVANPSTRSSKAAGEATG
jgi:uncharacterized membrane protein YcfT